MLTKEMQKAFDRLKVQMDSADDFPVGLKVFRAGLIAYGVLGHKGLQSMYQRKKLKDDEVMFLLEEGFVKDDFRPIKIEPIHQATERKMLNDHFGNVIENWDELKESAKMYHMERARKYPDVPNANKLLVLVKEVAMK